MAEDGAYFIDRNYRVFEDILDFLRDGNIHIPEDKRERFKLLKEAEFFEITEIANLCKLGEPAM